MHCTRDFYVPLCQPKNIRSGSHCTQVEWAHLPPCLTALVESMLLVFTGDCSQKLPPQKSSQGTQQISKGAKSEGCYLSTLGSKRPCPAGKKGNPFGRASNPAQQKLHELLPSEHSRGSDARGSSLSRGYCDQASQPQEGKAIRVPDSRKAGFSPSQTSHCDQQN